MYVVLVLYFGIAHAHAVGVRRHMRAKASILPSESGLAARVRNSRETVGHSTSNVTAKFSSDSGTWRLLFFYSVRAADSIWAASLVGLGWSGAFLVSPQSTPQQTSSSVITWLVAPYCLAVCVERDFEVLLTR